jgi:hypothetical protein
VGARLLVHDVYVGGLLILAVITVYWLLSVLKAGQADIQFFLQVLFCIKEQKMHSISEL